MNLFPKHLYPDGPTPEQIAREIRRKESARELHVRCIVQIEAELSDLRARLEDK